MARLFAFCDDADYRRGEYTGRHGTDDKARDHQHYPRDSVETHRIDCRDSEIVEGNGEDNKGCHRQEL